MEDKRAVLSRYPDAVAEQDAPDLWAVFDLPMSAVHGVRFHGDVAQFRGMRGCGRTESEAWKDARQKIERHEGKRLTPNDQLRGRGPEGANE